MGGHAPDDIGQPGEGVDPVRPAGSQQGHDHRGGPATGLTAQEQPVLPSHRDAADGAFRRVVVDGQFAVGGVDREAFAVAQDEIPGLLHRRTRAELPGFEIIE